MSNPSKAKGDRSERMVVALLNGIPGVHAERVPLSGAAGGTYSSDIDLSIPGPLGLPMYLKAEVKARAKAAGWQTIKGWMGDNPILVLKEDRKEPLVVLSWDLFSLLLTQAALSRDLPEPELPPLKESLGDFFKYTDEDGGEHGRPESAGEDWGANDH